jgi:hypothetical protein
MQLAIAKTKSHKVHAGQGLDLDFHAISGLMRRTGGDPIISGLQARQLPAEAAAWCGPGILKMLVAHGSGRIGLCHSVVNQSCSRPGHDAVDAAALAFSSFAGWSPPGRRSGRCLESHMLRWRRKSSKSSSPLVFNLRSFAHHKQMPASPVALTGMRILCAERLDSERARASKQGTNPIDISLGMPKVFQP